MSSKEEAEFAAVLAEIQAEDASSAEEVVEDVEESDEITESVEETDGDSEDSAPEEEPLEVADQEAFKNEIADLLDQGDLKKACEKLGVDPAIFKINNRQFAAIRKGEAATRRAVAEADAKVVQATEKETKAEALQRRAEEVYGPIVGGSKAAKGGDWSRAKAAVELMFEMPFEKVVENIKNGVRPLDPAQVEVLKLRQELEQERASKRQEESKAAESSQQAKDIQVVTSKLAGTPLDGIEGAAEEIVRVIRASYDAGLKKNTLTLKEAYKQVKESYQKKAAQLAKLSGVKPVAPATSKPSRAPLTKPAAGKSSKPSEKDEFAASIAEAAKAANAATRRSGRSR